MLWRFKHLNGYTIQATDGDIGTIQDVLLDERSWTVRYVVVDTGGWMSRREVLLSPAVLRQPDRATLKIPVDLTREKVRNSPAADTERPLTRRHIEDLHGYYGWTPWWGEPSVSAGLLGSEPLVEPSVMTAPTTAAKAEGEESDANLRSAREIGGYRIAASDGDVGHVDDVLIDQDGWLIRYFIVDTGNWLRGRRVLIAPSWVSGIDWMDEKVAVNLTKDRIKGSPEYAPDKDLDRRYEHDLHDWYGHTPYW